MAFRTVPLGMSHRTLCGLAPSLLRSQLGPRPCCTFSLSAWASQGLLSHVSPQEAFLGQASTPTLL